MSDDPVIMPPRPDELVRRVGRELLERGLGQGRSMFTPDRAVWTEPTVTELHRLYNEQPDTSADRFVVKLRRQLATASDDAIQLAAELLTLQGLPLVNLTAATLRERVTEVLSWMRRPVSIPPHVLAAFSQGTWSGGIGAHTMLWKWLADAVDFLGYWWSLPSDQRDAALAGPWAWQEVVYRRGYMPSLREELLYLAFPTHFLPILSVADKKAIRDTFADPGTPLTGDLNRDLFEITVRIQRQTGQPVDFYRQSAFAHMWRKQAERPPGERRAWLVRPRQGGPELVRRWRAESFVSLAASHLGEVAPGASRAEVRAAVEAGYPHVDYAQRMSLAIEFHAFLSRMAGDDIVVTLLDEHLHVGVLAGEPEHHPDDDAASLRRTTGWLTHDPIPVESLPTELDQQGAVVDLTGAIDLFTPMIGAEEDADAPREPEQTSPAPRTAPKLKPATDELAGRVHIGRPWLQEIIEVWRDRSQIVLYGPPGTGKTYLARALASHVADRDAVRLVQFHPSYAYEDFFEGFRPVEGADGTVGFAKTPGPLREIAAEAKENPEQPYVLIIDEINRANLAKVFGELYFLLEYRQATVRLQYSPSDPFGLPPNVFIIGTMNTADRSIALVDAAIRRRFAFIELHPDESPVREVLSTWLDGNAEPGDERAALLTALNDAIDDEQDRDFKIGPSYLMRPNLDSEAALDRVWRYDLMPLLEEHYYGRLSRAQIRDRFGLAAIRARIQHHE
ncbi:AAA family ATPase [Actinoplanes sp. NEAU-A12]|uniref:AAA family ATPase n=1 Tax=Actinoplanes sandaracinus TaxID=3045177 RepID=A0ABT6WUI4_9ACTN|nr:AAA family ATPase [Actinoplanes sandaracinus]MDI6103405.1 AAA family ATPase [Actinoplanes sandaracinus]